MSGGTGQGQGLGRVVHAAWAAQAALADHQAAVATLAQACTLVVPDFEVEIEEGVADTAAYVCEILCCYMLSDLFLFLRRPVLSQRPEGSPFGFSKLVHAGGTMDVQSFGQHVALVSSEARVILVRSLCRAC